MLNKTKKNPITLYYSNKIADGNEADKEDSQLTEVDVSATTLDY